MAASTPDLLTSDGLDGRTVGLTAAQLEQVRRAERAYALLQAGVSPAEAATRSGFADQPT